MPEECHICLSITTYGVVEGVAGGFTTVTVVDNQVDRIQVGGAWDTGHLEPARECFPCAEVWLFEQAEEYELGKIPHGIVGFLLNFPGEGLLERDATGSLGSFPKGLLPCGQEGEGCRIDQGIGTAQVLIFSKQCGVKWRGRAKFAIAWG